MSDPKTMNQLRNAKLSPERRSEIARQAAKARWAKRIDTMEVEVNRVSEELRNMARKARVEDDVMTSDQGEKPQ